MDTMTGAETERIVSQAVIMMTGDSLDGKKKMWRLWGRREPPRIESM